MPLIVAKHDLNLAAEFFFCFSRFEYSLKVAGYLADTRDAQPDWRRLADEVEPMFLSPKPKDFAAATRYYLRYPPNKQINDQGQISWASVEPETNLVADKVLVYVRRVRNNLFHGGKFTGGFLSDPPRSEQLMKHGVTILTRCLQELPSLSAAYDGKSVP